MKQYQIMFFRRKNDSIAESVYYREFSGFSDLVEWCNAIKNECSYSRYKHKVIALSKFLQNV